MASKRETVLAAEVKRNLAKAERIPPSGLVVIGDDAIRAREHCSRPGMTEPQRTELVLKR